jgi:signal transduction histidine kinase
MSPAAGPDRRSLPDAPVTEWVIDLLMALTLTVLAVGSVMVTDPLDSRLYPAPDLRLAGLAVLGSLPLALRRRYPTTVFLVCFGSWLVIWAVGWNDGVVPACSLFALYASAAFQNLRRALVPLAVMLVGISSSGLWEDDSLESWPLGLATLIGFSLVWGGGASVRRVRLRQAESVRRALEAERTRAAVAERAVFAERLRIARELHDVVSHTLSVIAVQAGVARHLLAPGDAAVAPALATIEEASRTALDDLRRMLGILRAGPSDQASLVPSPGLDELELLASTHRVTHGPVELQVDPDVGELPESLRMTVFRVVQEGLTNVRKHAPGAPARVAVRMSAGELVVQVDNEAPTAAVDPTTSGFGLAGMRERVALFDGRLDVGPHDGGYRLRVVLPLQPAEVIA